MSLTFTHDHLGLSVTVDDVEATIQWYTSKLDFAVEQRFESHGTSFVFVTHGDIKIELIGAASNRGQAPVDDIVASLDPARVHHVCMAVDDLDATLSQLRERDVHAVGEPMDVAEIGQRIAFITDNCGNIIELTQPVA
jgi:predicted enzyme related to lactoylglutathione lyase